MLRAMLILGMLINAEASSFQTNIQLIMSSNNGVFNNTQMLESLLTKQGLKAQINLPKIAIIWGKSSPAKASIKTMLALSRLTNNSNIIIGKIIANKIYWSIFIEGTTYYWQTQNNTIKNQINTSLISFKHHINPNQNYIPITLSIKEPITNWPHIKLKLQKICPNSKWRIIMKQKQNITASSLINSRECLAKIKYPEIKNHEPKNI